MSVAHLPPQAPGAGKIQTFEGAGGRRLRYRYVGGERDRRTLIYLHGLESHGGWFLPAAFELGDAGGCQTFLLDRRGSGLNRDGAAGEMGPIDGLVEDVRRLRAEIGDPPVHLVGSSWGAKLAVAAALDRPEGVLSITMITPGLKAQFGLTPWLALRFLGGLLRGGGNRFDVPITPDMFTPNRDLQEFIRNDPWRLGQVNGRFILRNLQIDRIVRSGLPRLRAPVLVFLARHERIIDNDGVREILGALPEGQLTEKMYEDATHSIPFDKRQRMVADMLEFFRSVEP